MLDLKKWFNGALVDTQRSAAIDKESVDTGLKETHRDLRHLHKYLSGVDAILKAKFPNPQKMSQQTRYSEPTHPRAAIVTEESSGAAASSGAPPGLRSGASSSRALPPTHPQEAQRHTAVFSTTLSRVRPGAI